MGTSRLERQSTVQNEQNVYYIQLDDSPKQPFRAGYPADLGAKLSMHAASTLMQDRLTYGGMLVPGVVSRFGQKETSGQSLSSCCHFVLDDCLTPCVAPLKRIKSYFFLSGMNCETIMS